MQRIRQRAQTVPARVLAKRKREGTDSKPRKKQKTTHSSLSSYLLELDVPSPRGAEARASMYMWMAPRGSRDVTDAKGDLRLADFALSIIGYRVGNAYWWFVQNDKASPPVLPTPPSSWTGHKWDPVIQSINPSNWEASWQDFALSKESIHQAVMTFSRPPPDNQNTKVQRHKDLLTLSVALEDAVKFQCMEALVNAAWMEPRSQKGEQTVFPASIAVLNPTGDQFLAALTVKRLRTSWAPVIEAAELREQKLVYVGISNGQVSRGVPGWCLPQTAG